QCPNLSVSLERAAWPASSRITACRRLLEGEQLSVALAKSAEVVPVDDIPWQQKRKDPQGGGPRGGLSRGMENLLRQRVPRGGTQQAVTKHVGAGREQSQRYRFGREQR